MSLKAFHLFFIAICIVLAFGFGLWSIRSYSTTGEAMDVLLGIGSFLLGAALIIYGIRVRRKLKQVTHE